MILIAFDLDDTLFDEVEFLYSAYRQITSVLSTYNETDSEQMYRIMVQDGFDALISHIGPSICQAHGITIGWLVETYRRHTPESLSFREGMEETLQWLSADKDISIGIITDGRVGTQTAKINALGLNRFVKPGNTIISQAIGADKTTPIPFTAMMSAVPQASHYIYIGDNMGKDFVYPKKLGWTTICMA